MTDERINLIHLGLTPGEYREIITALKEAHGYIVQTSDDEPTDDVLDYLTNALEILNEQI